MVPGYSKLKAGLNGGQLVTSGKILAMTNILIVDDHQMFVDGLSDILGQEQELQIVGICTTGTTIYRQLAEKKVDILT